MTRAFSMRATKSKGFSAFESLGASPVSETTLGDNALMAMRKTNEKVLLAARGSSKNRHTTETCLCVTQGRVFSVILLLRSKTQMEEQGGEAQAVKRPREEREAAVLNGPPVLSSFGVHFPPFSAPDVTFTLHRCRSG